MISLIICTSLSFPALACFEQFSDSIVAGARSMQMAMQPTHMSPMKAGSVKGSVPWYFVP